jgi:hypothetical protein
MHLAIVPADEPADAPAVSAPADLDAAILHTLDQAGRDGRPRASLRASLRVRNERLGDALTRRAASGHITRRGDVWVRVPVPIPPRIDACRNRNGNALGPDG